MNIQQSQKLELDSDVGSLPSFLKLKLVKLSAVHTLLIVSLVLGLSSRLICLQDICSRSTDCTSDTLPGLLHVCYFLTNLWGVCCQSVQVS